MATNIIVLGKARKTHSLYRHLHQAVSDLQAKDFKTVTSVWLCIILLVSGIFPSGT